MTATCSFVRPAPNSGERAALIFENFMSQSFRCVGYSLAALISIALASFSLSGCGSKVQTTESEGPKFRPADDSGTTEASPTGAGGVAATEPGRAGQIVGAKQLIPPGGTGEASTAVAGGTDELEGILSQLNRLAQQQPRGNSPQEQIEDLVK